MNKEKYLEMRNALLKEAQEAIDNGDVETAKAKTNEVRSLDEKWDANLC